MPSRQKWFKATMRSGLRIRGARGHPEVRGALIRYAKWLRKQYGFPVLVHYIISDNSWTVIATMNLNGDYISDALAAQVGGIGIAPGANIGDSIAVFEATHGTAPRYAGQDKVNPGSLILSGEMMLRHLDWQKAADLIIKGTESAITL